MRGLTVKLMSNQEIDEIVDAIIKEIPLKQWIEKGDSKISATYFMKIPFELLRIYYRYR